MSFINEIAIYIKKYAGLYGIKVYSPIIAQAILESGHGKSELAVNANNYFGIKYREGRCPTCTGVYVKVGSEQNTDGTYTSGTMKWCKFDSMEKCVVGYFDFINIDRYENLKGVTNPETYLKLIREDGYATSIEYVNNLMNVIKSYNLTQYDREVNNMVKIALDAGHGLNTSGKQTPDHIKEWTLNDKVRDKVVEYLKGYNVEIIHVDNNEGKTDESLSYRLNKYINAGVSAFVSIHHNAYTGKWNNATGVEVYTDTKYTSADNRLAKSIYERLVNYTGLRGRGIKRANFTVINQNKIPAVLVEGGFMDGTKDYKTITSEAGQDAYARAVAEGLVEFLGLERKVNTVSQPDKLYRVQCGAFRNKDNAEALRNKLKAEGYEAVIVSGS